MFVQEDAILRDWRGTRALSIPCDDLDGISLVDVMADIFNNTPLNPGV